MPNNSNRRVASSAVQVQYDGLSNVKNLGAGDSYYIAKFLKPSERSDMFFKILNESDFVQMFHFKSNGTDVEPIPRLVTAQTATGDSKTPVYRMPGCNERNIPTTPWTDTVQDMCARASSSVGQELNHCVLTLFRDQDDSLAFHQDKLLDLEDGSMILSLSLGAPRPILFYANDTNEKQQITLQPGSLLAIGPKTNKMFKHAIPKLAYNIGPRISLSVRTVKTFVESNKIVGKGEEYQDQNYPFCKSYCNNSDYSEDVQKKIDAYTENAAEQLKVIRELNALGEDPVPLGGGNFLG